MCYVFLLTTELNIRAEIQLLFLSFFKLSHYTVYKKEYEHERLILSSESNVLNILISKGQHKKENGFIPFLSGPYLSLRNVSP